MITEKDPKKKDLLETLFFHQYQEICELKITQLFKNIFFFKYVEDIMKTVIIINQKYE